MSADAYSIGARLSRLEHCLCVYPCITPAGYSIDITIPSMRVAIEADGPSHFSRTTRASSESSSKSGAVQLGATAMKRRHLQGLGWAVVNVPYIDWDKLTDEASRADYLKRRIQAATAIAAAAAGAEDGVVGSM